jgi:predicted phage terminase large subunit-like protein
LVTHNSTYASHLFPAWYLGRNPKKRYLQAGHTQKFCEDELGKKVRNNVKSEAYQKIFPDIHIPQDTSAAATWAIAKYGGKYMVRAVGQGIAGLRGHIAGVDDPYPLLEDAESQTYRDKVYNWFMSDFKTRLLPNSPLFCVMTRWHGDDLAGRLEESNNNKSSIPYTVINLPIICAEEGDPLGRKIGDLLWPELFNFQFVADVKSSMIPRVWASLYAGNPIPDNGNMLKPEWIRRYSEENTIFSNKISALGHDKFVTVSVDTANKATERSDYSAITVWYQVNDKHYLIDVVRRRMEYTELVSTIEYQARKHKANVILVEDAGTGTQYHIQATNTNHTPPCPVVAIKPHGSSKEFKFDAVLPLFEGGHVFLPANADWLGTYEKELLEFPSSKNDDQVDSTSQYLLYRRPKAKFGSQKMNSTAAAKTTGNFQPDEAIDLVRTGFVDMSHAQDA